ncbi:MAG: hypothetical protein JJ896_11950 [Rhodothermales bacterium]|nr:hypothetical protein [Rhodothermales bacterium]MBO6780357.1 hypothetical protein [Rhodothermales bacterium]
MLAVSGPSGVGKTTLRQALRARDGRFENVAAFTTRPIRPGDSDRLHISDQEMDRLISSEHCIGVNDVYGARYATPVRPITDVVRQGKVAVLDWPCDRIGELRSTFRAECAVVYLIPPNSRVLRERLTADTRDPSGERLRLAIEELYRIRASGYAHVDHVLTTASDPRELARVVEQLLANA